MYKIASTCKIIGQDEKVVVANRKNGMWIRISKEIYHILELLCDGIFLNELEFEDKNDKSLIEKIVKVCRESDILLPAQENEVLNNSIVSIEMTHRCNLKCIHCCVDAQNTMLKSADLSSQEIKNIFDKLIVWNPSTIMLSGGEPMLRKDFFELASYLRENYNGKIIVSTNGTLITIQNVKQLTKVADQIDMSLDGYNEESCAQIRGKGVFEKVIEAVNLLQAYEFSNISLSMVVSDKNEIWETEFRRLNKKLNTRANCRIFSPVGRGEVSKGFFSAMSDEKVYIPSEYLNNEEKPASFSCCKAGKREIFIDYRGNVYPCPSYAEEEYKLGNILSISSLNEITVTYEHIDLIIKRLQVKGVNACKCKECCVNIFCWTCPGAVEFFVTQEALEFQCKIVYPMLFKKVWEKER